jgi:20S proteasome alpha/beta subunit
MMCSFAKVHAFSISPITSYSSWLFRSMGSTTSMFSEYLRSSVLNKLKVLLT